jgi:hypothetical protein
LLLRVTAKERRGPCGCGEQIGRRVSTFKDFWQMALSGAKPKADLVLLRYRPARGRQKMAEFPLPRSGSGRLLPLYARTLPPLTGVTLSLWMKYDEDSSLPLMEHP